MAVVWQAVRLFLFAGTVLAACCYGLAVAGHFPAAVRTDRLKSMSGRGILWGTAALAVAALLVVLAIAARQLPWPQLVLAACFAVLFSPLALQPLPDRFVNGRRGLLVLSACAALLAALTWALA